jgi:REP element-mobilizing transposase RayT
LDQYRERYNFKIYARVLMSNHVHLLIETDRVPLYRIMQGLQLSYTALQSNPLLSGRVFVGAGSLYSLESGADEASPESVEVLLSSHPAYVGEPGPVTIQTTSVLKQFGSNASVARRGYLAFMKERLGQGHLDRFYQTLEQRFLGDEQFVDEVEKKKKEREPVRIKVKFPRLVEGVASVYGIEAGRLVGTERKRSWVEPRSLLLPRGSGAE